MTREELIDIAVGANENYRIAGEEEHDLELGFLVGTAEMITMMTLGDTESYHDVREKLIRIIDQRASKNSYPLVPERQTK